jgi:hypothetical protein
MINPPRRFSLPDPSPTKGHDVPESVREATATTLLPMTVASINDTLPGWLEQRLTPGVALAPGGWEAWAPVDLLGWLHESLGATATRRWDAQREVRVFTEPERRVALVFNTATHDLLHPMLVVEVVAESLLEDSAAFLQRMRVTSERLRPGNLAPSYAVARRMVLALSVEPGTAEALQEHEFGVVAMTKAGCAALWRVVGVGG